MDNTDKILAYLENQLSEEEKAGFEKELEGDNTLQQELQFQKELISNIKAVRKAELKSMLNNIPVGGTAVVSAGQFIAGITAVVLIGAGVYYFYPEHEEKLSSGPTIEQYNSNPVIEDNLSEEEPREAKEVAPEEKKPGTKSSAENKRHEIAENNNENLESEPDTEGDRTIKESDSSASIIKPTIPDGISNPDQENEDFSSPDNRIQENTLKNSETLDITIISDNTQFDFHYQFKDSKLYLYGSFKDKYEILDFKKDNDRALYLYISDAYYPLSTASKSISPLEKIKNVALISELDKMRAKSD